MMGFTITLDGQDAIDWLNDRTGNDGSEVPPTFGTNGIQLDVDGLPWDARINSAGRAIVADGRWKKKRGVDASYISAVQAELRSALAVPAPAPAPVASVPAPPPTVASAEPPVSPVNTIPATVSDGVVPTASPISFPALMQAIIKGKFEQATVLAALQSVGLESLPALAQRSDLIPNVASALGIGGAA